MKCPKCGYEWQGEAMESFLQVFGGGSAGHKRRTLNDEMKEILGMGIGDQEEWGEGTIERRNAEVWVYHHPDIEGGQQWFSAHVDLRGMAMRYPMIEEDFVDRMGKKFWTSAYDWQKPDHAPYNGFTGFTSDQVERGVVSCAEVGLKGLKVAV